MGYSMSLPSILLLYMLVVSQLTYANVLLIGKNKTLSFEDIQANFTPKVKKSDQRGVLYVAEPIDACSDLANTGPTASPPYLLIIRGGCSFEDKVRNAQKAGYRAAIVYDNQDDGFLVSMSGNPSGVHIYGTFVSKATGEVLKEYVGRTGIELWLMPSVETSQWTIMTVSFIFLLAVSAVLATIFFLRRQRIRRQRVPYSPMTPHSIGKLPVITFTRDCEESSSTSIKCAICLEKYKIGDQLRILPCHHKFHVAHIDEWLGQWKSFCPVCKRDARTTTATEQTPLLSSPPQSSHYLAITITTSPD